MKTCNDCKRELPATTEYYGRRTNIKCGLDGRCKECIARSYNEYRIKNNEKLNANRKKWEKDNFEYRQEYKKQYNLKNKDHIEKYRKANKDRLRDMAREWERKDRIENPDRYVMKTTLRRSRLKGVEATLDLKQWHKIKKDFSYKCAYCGVTEKEHIKREGQKLHREHFIPLSYKGELTHNNIIPSCRSCNSSKGNKDFFGWYKQYEHYDSKREQFILKYLNYTTEDTQQLALL